MTPPPQLDDASVRTPRLPRPHRASARGERTGSVRWPTRTPSSDPRLVRKLLAEDRSYADHWLAFWNDALRNEYKGTGYIDGGRKQITAWLYKSLLDNKPYDKFARELISPTPDSEGFAKGHRARGEVNASQIVELQFSQNVGQVFFGANLKCVMSRQLHRLVEARRRLRAGRGHRRQAAVGPPVRQADRRDGGAEVSVS